MSVRALPEPRGVGSRLGRWAWGWAKSLVVALVVWFLLSTFLIQAFHVTSGSMERTLLVGDFLFVNKLLYGAELPLSHRRLPAIREPRHDEVVVIQSPIEDLVLLKRLVGLPGDTLAMENGRLVRNGAAIAEPWVHLAGQPPDIDDAARARMRAWQLPYLVGSRPNEYHPDLRNWGPLVVPPGYVMTLGDNRDESFDSRYYGFIPRANLRGKPLFVYFSYDPTSWRPLPFVTAIRWGRLFSSPNAAILGALAQTPATTPIVDRAIATLTIPGYADFLAADGRAVWTTNEGRVEKLQHDHSGVVASVPVPEPCGAMVVSFQSLWVASCRDSSVYRIDLSSAKVLANIRTGLADPTGELSLAAGAGSVWVLSDAKGVLTRIDPVNNRVAARITVQPHSYTAAFAFGAVWITTTGPKGASTGGSVQRVDPARNEVVATIPVGPVPRFLAAGEGAVWTLNQGDGSVTRIDPRTNAAVASIPVGMSGGGGDIATGQGRVWVRGTKILLAAIDPATNRVIEIFGPAAGSGAVRVAEDLIWVTAHDTRTVWVMRARP